MPHKQKNICGTISMKITAVSGLFSITGVFLSLDVSESFTEKRQGRYPVEFSMTFGLFG